MMKKISAALALAICATISGTAAYAHEDDNPELGKGLKPPPVAILQLDQTRDAAAKFIDVDAAVKAGYVDIGLFVPNMGWHYMKESLVDEKFDWTRPELLVYADDPCGGKRKLVAVEYAVPLSASRKAPFGFVGKADQWDANQDFQLWTLHAWVYEFNPDGVFAPFNKRIP